MTDQSIALPRPLTAAHPKSDLPALTKRLRARLKSAFALPTVQPKDHWLA